MAAMWSTECLLQLIYLTITPFLHIYFQALCVINNTVINILRHTFWIFPYIDSQKQKNEVKGQKQFMLLISIGKKQFSKKGCSSLKYNISWNILLFSASSPALENTVSLIYATLMNHIQSHFNSLFLDHHRGLSLPVSITLL